MQIFLFRTLKFSEMGIIMLVYPKMNTMEVQK